jgi:hypothetical protein
MERQPERCSVAEPRRGRRGPVHGHRLEAGGVGRASSLERWPRVVPRFEPTSAGCLIEFLYPTGSPMTARRPGRVRLYRMPAVQLLAALPPGSIDLLITDPPYVTVDRGSGSGHLRDWFKDGLTWREIGLVLAAARRKMKPTGVAFVMTNGAGLRDALGALERARFERVRTIAWNRRYPGLGSGLRHQIEFILVGRLPGSQALTGVDLISVAAVGPGTADRYPRCGAWGRGRPTAARTGPHRAPRRPCRKVQGVPCRRPLVPDSVNPSWLSLSGFAGATTGRWTSSRSPDTGVQPMRPDRSRSAAASRRCSGRCRAPP